MRTGILVVVRVALLDADIVFASFIALDGRATTGSVIERTINPIRHEHLR